MEGETLAPVVEIAQPAAVPETVAVVAAEVPAEPAPAAVAEPDAPMTDAVVVADAPAPAADAVVPVADAPAAAAAPAVEEKKPKPKRVTPAQLKKHICKGKLLENQLFTWRSCVIPEGCDEGDFIFEGCKMKVDLKNADGVVVTPAGKMVKRVEWYTSHSTAAFFPTKFNSSAILLPLVLQPTDPIKIC